MLTKPCSNRAIAPKRATQKRTPDLCVGRSSSLSKKVVDIAEGIASGVGGMLDFQVHGEDYAETAFSKDCATKPTRKRNGNEGYRRQILPSQRRKSRKNSHFPSQISTFKSDNGGHSSLAIPITEKLYLFH